MSQGFTSSLPIPVPVNKGGTGVVTSTGTGNVVLSTSPTLVTPALGTPASGVLTNCTGFSNDSTFFRARNGTNQSINSSTLTKVILDTEDADAGGWFDSTTNYRYTPLKAGKYLIIASGWISVGADQIGIEIDIYKNGAVNSALAVNTSGTGANFLPSSSIIDMNGTTDYIEMYVYHNTGSAKNLIAASNYTYFTGIRISA